jgi:DNA modification methylase
MADSNKLAVQYRPIGDLIPYARNSRTHSDAQVAQIASSIREFGWTNPVLVDGENGIIAGHGRVMAARKLGLAEVPVIELKNMSEAQKRAYVIADNQLALNAGWDLDLLKVEVAELGQMGFDLDLLGFDGKMLDGLLAPDGTDGLTDPDEIPPPPEDPVSVPGDLWVMGNHRIICGSSTVETDVTRLFGPVKPNLMVTDPPYGVNYDPEWRHKVGVNNSKRTGKVLNDDVADWRDAWALFPGDVAYVWHGALHATTVAESLMACDFNIRSQIIWAKPRLVIGRGDYHWQHEPCWYAVRKTGKGHWAGDRKQTTLWTIDQKGEDAETIHGTQKPVECMKRPIENNSSPGQAVYEPFSGSGTTIIAGEMTGRCVYAVELNPAYVDVAILRWQAFTGQNAVLDGDGRTFTEILAERQPAKVIVGAEKAAKKKAAAKSTAKEKA